MFVAAVIVNVLLAALLIGSAGMKLSHRPDVVEGYAKVGVPESRLNLLAALLLAGAGGLLVGLFWEPLGVAAAACLVAYFLLAVGAHIRHDDAKALPVPLVIEGLAIAALVLRTATM